MRCTPALLVAPLLLAGLSAGAAAQERPYTEGAVTVSSYIRIKPGMFDKYMAYLATDYKRNLDAQKQAGVVLDYAVLNSPFARADEWNMVLTVTYKNMAALDGIRDRTEPIAMQSLKMTPAQMALASIEREAMRELVGSRLLRVLTLK